MILETPLASASSLVQCCDQTLLFAEVPAYRSSYAVLVAAWSRSFIPLSYLPVFNLTCYTEHVRGDIAKTDHHVGYEFCETTQRSAARSGQQYNNGMKSVIFEERGPQSTNQKVHGGEAQSAPLDDGQREKGIWGEFHLH